MSDGKNPDIPNVTFVCPKCGKPVTWTKIKFANGSELSGLDWICESCGGEAITLSAHRRGYLADPDE